MVRLSAVVILAAAVATGCASSDRSDAVTAVEADRVVEVAGVATDGTATDAAGNGSVGADTSVPPSGLGRGMPLPPAMSSAPCPVEVAILQSLVVAASPDLGHLPTEPELVELGHLPGELPGADLAADGQVVAVADVECRFPSWSVNFPWVLPACGDAIDRIAIDAFVGRAYGDDDDPVARAASLGVDHGPHEYYRWEGGPVAVGSTCPDGTVIQLQVESCIAQRKTLETAAEAYTAATGAPPATEESLVAEGYLRVIVDGFDLLPDGTVTAVRGAGCV